MPSARIYHFPRRRRFRPPAPASTPFPRPAPHHSGVGFPLLLAVTLVAACLYLSGAVKMPRHDELYAALLAVVWGFYFSSETLRRTRVLGPLLTLAGQWLPLAAAVSFLSFALWLVLWHP